MILVFLLSLIMVVSSQTQEQPLCSRLGSVYKSMCPGQVLISTLTPRQAIPGKRGPAGSKGEKGAKGGTGIKGDQGRAGPKGETLDVDYDRVEAKISRRLQAVNQSYAQKLSELSTALMEAEKKIQEFENRSGACPVRFRDKCFWFSSDDRKMNYHKAEEVCETQGGKPANVYNMFHYYMLLEYLRMFSWATGYSHAWLGIKRDIATDTVVLTTGVPAPFVKWHPGYPDEVRQHVYASGVG